MGLVAPHDFDLGDKKSELFIKFLQNCFYSLFSKTYKKVHTAFLKIFTLITSLFSFIIISGQLFHTDIFNFMPPKKIFLFIHYISGLFKRLSVDRHVLSCHWPLGLLLDVKLWLHERNYTACVTWDRAVVIATFPPMLCPIRTHFPMCSCPSRCVRSWVIAS